MDQSLSRRVEALRRLARLLVMVRAGCLSFALVAAGWLLFGWLDWTMRASQQPIRFLGFAGLVGLFSFALVRWILPALRFRPTSVDVARRLESRLPAVGSRLSTAVDVLGQPQYSGSMSIRQAIVRESAHELAQLRLRQIVNWPGVLIPLLFVFALALCAALAVNGNGAMLRRGMVRISIPWIPLPWPRVNDLRINPIPPSLVSVGATMNVDVRDVNRRNPGEVVLQVRYPDGSTSEFPMKLHSTDNSRFAISIRVGDRDFALRAAGGDDQTEWYHIGVVQPPQVGPLVWTVRPPSYAGLPELTTSGDFQAVSGSTVAVAGTTDRPVRSIEIRYRTDGGVSSAPADVEQTGDFHLSADALVLRESGELSLQISDLEGIQSTWPAAVKVTVRADQPPTVVADYPLSTLQATVDTRFELPIQVHDDLGIESAEVLVGTHQSSWTLPLEAATSTGEPRTPTQLSASKEVNISALGGRRVGDQMSIRAVATDSSGQVGESAESLVTIVAPQVMRDELARVVRAEYEQLRSIVARQQKTSELTGQLLVSADSPIDDLRVSFRHVHREQTTVSAQLFEAGSGSLDRLRRLALTATAHGLQQDDWKPIVERAIDRLQLCREQPFARIDWSLELVEQVLSAASPPAQHLSELLQAQQTAVEQLNLAADQFLRWYQARDTAAALGELRSEQEQLNQSVDETWDQFQGQNLDQLLPEQRRTLAWLESRQRRLGRKLDQLATDVGYDVDSGTTDDPGAIARMERMLSELTSRRLPERMSETADAVGANQLQRAIGLQQQLVTELSHLIALLDPNSTGVSAAAVPPASQAAAQLAALIRTLLGLIHDNLELELGTDDPSQRVGQRDELLSRLHTLSDALQVLADTLSGQGFGQPAAHVERAGRGLLEMSSGDPNQPLHDDRLESVVEALMTAARQLDESRQDDVADQPPWQVRLQAELPPIIDTQRQVSTWSERVRQTTAPEAVFQILAQLQSILQQQFDALRQSQPLPPALEQAAQTVSELMQQARHRIAAGQTGVELQLVQRSTTDLLQSLLEASSVRPASNPPSDDQPSGEQGERPFALNPHELALIYALQKSIARDTADWHAHQQLPQADNQRMRLSKEHLAARQLQLADWIQQITQRAADNSKSPSLPRLPDFQ